MASQGPNSPGTVADGGGSVAWTNLNNVKLSDNNYSSAGYSYSTNTNILKATNFGFSIPSGATINGIVAEIERKKVGSLTGVKDVSIKIIKSDGTIGSTNKADTSTEWPTSDAYKSYGSSSDLWGETWTYTDINDADFGISLIAYSVIEWKIGDSQPYVDHIRITVYYTEGGSSSAIKSVNGLAKASVKSVNGLAIASVKNINGLE